MDQTLPKGYIDKKNEEPTPYEQIYMEGIDLLQKLSGANWTDYNEHDPGVTILENICYTLTNLSYKADLPISDILRGSKGSEVKSGDNGLFIPSEIFTTSPITITDYRKLFIDNIRNFKNVFIKTKKENKLKGLYDIYVEMYEYDDDAVKLQKEKKKKIREVTELYHANRNLCENLYNVTVLDPYYLDLKLELTLSENANGDETLAKIYFAVKDYLTHEVRFSSLFDLQNADLSIDTIFDGPVLKNGFIKDSEFQEMKLVLYPDKIMKLIGKIEEVISVDVFCLNHVSKKGKKLEVIDGDMLRLPSNVFPILIDPTKDSELSFRHEGVSFQPNIEEVNYQLFYLDKMYYGEFKSVSKSINAVEIPRGRDLELASYYPIREQFPLIYGIGEQGLEKRLPKKRYAQANQLKAFLLPFDQLMTNFLAQLSNIYTLYEVDFTKVQSYFTQELEDMPQLIELIKQDHCQEPEAALKNWSETLKSLQSNYDGEALQRLHKIADSLLARFGEEYPTNALKKINTNNFGSHTDQKVFDLNVLKWKSELIKNYHTIGYRRAKGFDYTQALDITNTKAQPFPDNTTVPGLIQKLGLLLGMEDISLRSLSGAIAKAGIKIDPKKEGYEDITENFEITYFDDEIVIKDRINIVEKPEENLKGGFYYSGNSGRILEEVLKNGIKIEKYGFEDAGSEQDQSQRVYYINDDESRQVVHIANNEKDAKKAISNTIGFLTDLNKKSEGFYLIEHILLAPNFHKNHFGFSFTMLVDISTYIEFEHASLTSFERRNNYVHDIIHNHANICLVSFCVEELDGAFTIQIHQGNDTIATSVNRYCDYREAYEVLGRIECSYMRGEEPYSIEILKYFACFGEHMVDESFFSFSTSYVLPSWPARFQNENFRTKFNNTVYENAPAHIAFDTFYPNFQEMMRFEAIFYDWIKVLSKKEEEEERMVRAYELIQILKEFQDKFRHH